MDGFNVLNEIAGAPITEVTGWGTALILLLIFSAAGFVASALCEETEMSALSLLLTISLGVILFNVDFTHETGAISPTRYEITLKPGAVIDATRWDIVEHRPGGVFGEIYVIQERSKDAD